MNSENPRYTAFQGEQRIAAGSLRDVAIAVMHAQAGADGMPLVFDNVTGAVVDLDLRGTEAEVLDRLALGSVATLAAGTATSVEPPPAEPRGRGRPKLGVVAREVTLLPRHWEWLNSQPGGASVALRKLVEAARRTSGHVDRRRVARDAAYRFMSAMCGNLPGFEEASRALFADDLRTVGDHVASWPADLRDHVMTLAIGAGGDPDTHAVGDATGG